MKAQQSKWILAAIFLLLLTTRENLAQEIGAPPASDDSNSGEAKENYIIPALEIVGFDFALNRFNQRYIDRESFNVPGRQSGATRRANGSSTMMSLPRTSFCTLIRDRSTTPPHVPRD